jgi:hypothetical protein
VPRGVTREDYWNGVAVSLANNKLCAMRSNMKQTMFNQFKGRFSVAHSRSDSIAIALNDQYVSCCHWFSGQE